MRHDLDDEDYDPEYCTCPDCLRTFMPGEDDLDDINDDCLLDKVSPRCGNDEIQKDEE